MIDMARIPWRQHRRFQCFAPENDIAQMVCLAAARLGTDQLPESARRLIQHRHLLFAQQLVELVRRPRDVFRHDEQLAAVR
ncbi:hypothetical protein A203_21680 [Chromobacterium violaceum]